MIQKIKQHQNINKTMPTAAAVAVCLIKDENRSNTPIYIQTNPEQMKLDVCDSSCRSRGLCGTATGPTTTDPQQHSSINLKHMANPGGHLIITPSGQKWGCSKRREICFAYLWVSILTNISQPHGGRGNGRCGPTSYKWS